MNKKTGSHLRLKKKLVSVYLEKEQQAALQELAKRTRRTQQTYLREGVEYILAKYKGAKS
jgi:predicted DNA-binding protein